MDSFFLMGARPLVEGSPSMKLHELPDASTICRFRNWLVSAGLDQKLLAFINGQLQQRGLKVQGARGAIIDATIIPSAARPRQYVQGEGEAAKVQAQMCWAALGMNLLKAHRQAQKHGAWAGADAP